MLGFNDTSTIVGHSVSSLREREMRDRKGDEREEHGRKKKMKQKKKKNIPPLPLPAARIEGIAQL